MTGGNVTSKSHITLDEQLEVDEALLKIQREIDELIEKVYLMGYIKGQNTQKK